LHNKDPNLGIHTLEGLGMNGHLEYLTAVKYYFVHFEYFPSVCHIFGFRCILWSFAIFFLVGYIVARNIGQNTISQVFILMNTTYINIEKEIIRI
jgi:hypothetical protein